MKQTTIKVAGKDYPLYKTMRGVVAFQKCQYTQQQLMGGDVEAILHLIYLHARGASIREKISFEFSFEEFVDFVDPDVLDHLDVLTDDEDADDDESPDKKKG
jgi:hypothetical protein